MGVLGKDLFEVTRSNTHVKVQFGLEGYWVESWPTPLLYGEVLTEILNCDVTSFEKVLSSLDDVVQRDDTKAAVRVFMDMVAEFSSLPYFRLFLSDLHFMKELRVEKLVVGEARTALEEYIFAEGKKDAAYMREQVNDIRFVQKRYTWFLEEGFQGAFEKKKGQRKIPLAQRLYHNGLDAFVSGVSLGESPQVDAPQVNIQYAVLKVGEDQHELVEKLYFDHVTDFVYVELMRGMQKGFLPKRCANCGRWFLQTPGASYNYCDHPAPNSEESRTCREVGATKSFRAKVLNNPVWAVHQRAYKKYFARTRKGTMSKTDFEVWEQESEHLRDTALARYNRTTTAGEKQRIVDKLTKDLNKL